MRKFTLSVLVLLVSVFFSFGQFAKTTDPVEKVITPFEVNVLEGVTADMYSIDFEAETAFTDVFTPWMVVDGDGLSTYTMSGVSWPMAGDAQAFIVFNPDLTDPPLTDDPDIQPYEGDQFGACVAAVPDGSQGNDDWFISDMVSIGTDGDGASFDFMARSYVDTYGLERFNVGVSTTTPDPAEFTIISGSSYIEAPIAWTPYTFDLSAYAGMDIYVAIQCVSYDAWIFMIDNLVINPGGGGGGDMCDNFDSYVAGDFLCTQSDMWTTWDDNPGGDYDGYVVDDMANSAPNSLGVDAAVIETDVVTDLGQTTSGVWEVSLDIYVPDGGFGGYFNVMQDMVLFGAANEWGFQIYFRSDGTGYFYDADFNQTDFTYNVAEWNHVALVVDLDMAMASLYIDGAMVGAEWQWDVDGPNMLGAVDIYAAADGNDDPKFYIDNFCFSEFVPGGNCDNFDSYVAGDFLCTQSDMWTTWDDNPGGDYDGYVVDDMALSAPNSLGVDAAVIETDVVTDLGQTTAGVWEVSLDIYVPDGGFGGYFNVMQDMELFGAANEWGFQIYFRSDGTGYFYDADFNQTDFTYNVAEWNHIALEVDLDMAMAKLYIDGAMVGDAWQWDVDGPNMLGAVDIYAAADGNDDPKFYIDNFCFEEAQPADDCDYFDTYVAGDFLCTQSDLWWTWDDNPGGDYDAYVVDDMAYSAPNSLGVDAAVIETDVVYDLGQMTSGTHEISLMMYVPDGGFGGYYNVMQDMELFGSANEWGFQVYFRSDGTGYFYDADFNQTDFTYNVGEWNECILYVDLDADLAQYVINGDILGTWQWSIDGPLMLGAVDIYAAADGNDDPKFYIDNFCYNPSSVAVGIEDPIAITSIETAIFPNPARDHVTIEANGIIDEILIYNNMGQLVFSGEVNNDQIMVNTSTFITGMYIVQIKSGENVEVRKLIIE